MELYNNYWKLIKDEIPSRGCFYNSDAVIKIRPLNVQEVKYLSTLSPQNATDIINEIISKCIILENLNFDDILLADREYMAFWLRANSFQQNNGYSLGLKCENCGHEYKHEVQLADFPTVLYDTNKPKNKEIVLPDCNIKLYLKYPTIKELKRTSNDNEIQNFMRHLDIDTNDNVLLERFLSNLSAMDYSVLKNNIDDMFIGFARQISVPCPSCGKLHHYSIELNDTGLFGTINIGDVLEIILRICKYTNYQIPETQPWWEVEVMQISVNKMQEEEERLLNKNNDRITLNKSQLQV